MNEARLEKQRPVTKTFEVALWELYQDKKELKMTKKQVKILTSAKNNRDSATFKELERLTKANAEGTYSVYSILSVIRKNQAELLHIVEGKLNTVKKVQREKRKSKKYLKEQILEDLKKPRLTFGGALAQVKRSMDQLQMTNQEKKIIKTARKEKDVFVKMKSLTKADKANTYSPFDVINTIYIMAGRKPNSAFQMKTTSKNEQNRKKLPLDTNYKYPTKTSKSIWTVRLK